MLQGNRNRVQNLSGLEIWLFIIGRVLVGFALGILAMLYFPTVSAQLAWPILMLGVVILVVASRGLLRKPPSESGG